MAPLLSTRSAPACGGKVVAPATKGGCIASSKARLACFPSGEARSSGFRRQRRHKKWRPSIRAPTSPAQRYYITPEGGALNLPVRRSRSQAEPLAPRAGGPAAPSTLSPAGAVNLREYSGAPNNPQKPIISNVAHSKKALTITVSASFLISSFLSSRAASSQVLSAFVSLTTVFGMGTGVSSQLSPLNL